MNSSAQQIKERLSVEEVISSYLKLEKAGVNLKARCPFHNEKTPSFFVSPVRGSYYCFGCGAKGDIFTFVQDFEGLDFRGALKLLAERAGVTLPEWNKEQRDQNARIYQAMETATVYFVSNLSKNEQALEYLKQRGLTEKSISQWRLGFAVDTWREMHDHLSREGFSDKEMEEAGLVKKSEGRCYDRFRGRIMFPMDDASGRVVAFSGRIFPDVPEQAKYLNSPETPIFKKSAVLYGFDKAKDSIRKNNFSILVEGQMDLILSHQVGYKNTVASSGTAFSGAVITEDNTVSNLGVVRRLSANMVIAFDADAPGIQAAMRAAKMALALGMDVKIAPIPEGTDPAEVIREGGAEAWREVIKNAKSAIEFFLHRIIATTSGDRLKLGRAVGEHILPLVGILESSIEQTHFLKQISDLSGITETALMADLGKLEDSSPPSALGAGARAGDAPPRTDQIIRRLLSIAFWQKNVKNPSVDGDKLLVEIGEILGENSALVVKRFPNQEDLIFEAEVFYGSGAELDRDLPEMILTLKTEKLRERLRAMMILLRNAEREGKTEEERKILEECQRITREIEDVKSPAFKK